MASREASLIENGLFRANNERYLKFYWAYLAKNMNNILGRDCQDKKELQLKISMVLLRRKLDVEGLINRMNCAALESLLPERSFDWIDKNDDRIVYFVWSLLRLTTPRSLKIDDNKYDFRFSTRLTHCIEYVNDKQVNYYQKLNLNPLPLHRSEALALIYDFFDQWDATSRSKEKLMLFLKEKWLYIASKLRPDYSWIDPKNKQQNDWISNYISSQLEWLPHLPPPMTTSQRYNINILNLDTLFIFRTNFGSKKRKGNTEHNKRLTHAEFMYKMMKAWKQKQFREKTGRASAKS
ncbi:hypothetical protein BST55_19325 [Vibrio vulnificus]|uniref:hypothetical protein n=1 Tax=Vibrio vulnificus TaxID=672 RepID=UPI000B9FF8F6|nr:hypothetical protein [Vibrio vulnificus]EGR8991570.1 hypothetical protein [Vibrio vulnificus]OZS51720.1 hypothetical protein BST51_19250 [Vibrio vulnificus]OZS56214.1 hypothetical protein BST52_19905 [Vibrio vulnificus]OZS60858.1 hypothetical protein BST56_19920 [Vibrio vulnificus]PAO26108.1 hypothetical protein BTT96_17880 [Vibrio vulnificus]